MQEIKRIVKQLHINEKREAMFANEIILLQTNYKMSGLTLHLPVAQYARLLNRLDQEIVAATFTGDGSKIDEVEEELALIDIDDNIKEYLRLRDKVFAIQREKSKYFQTINVEFRDAISRLDIPSIFVFQGYLDRNVDLKLARHIIVGASSEAFWQTPSTIIYPEADYTAKRDFKHFYNRISFKYLEQVSMDESFDLEGKRLGKYLIK